jgi:hypothetical protein
MRISGFELIEPLPELNEPHAIVTLRPWIDVGAAGTLAMSRLETRFRARELGKLARPGNFFDFTRYRPTIQTVAGVREVTIPNTIISYGKRQAGNDFVFVHLLEPHNLGEMFSSSVWQVLKTLNIKRYCLIGSMSDMVPHTRPLLVSGNIGGGHTAQVLEKLGVYQSQYQGPTTICTLIQQEAQKFGVETLTLIVHLPQYTDFEEDYQGAIALSGVLGALYDIPADEADVQKAASQSRSIDAALQDNPKLKAVVTELEHHYESRVASRRGKTDMPRLSPEVERFLKEQEDRLDDQ